MSAVIAQFAGTSRHLGSFYCRQRRLTDSQPMVLFSSPHCRDEFCTQLAH
jgi:hypothetical protein